MAHYVYSPLATPEHIRLLKVQTSCDEVNTTVDAKFDIIPVTLYETPGSMPGSPRTTDGSYVAITDSLLEALPFLVKASKTGYLWIDQLCINQDDHEERSVQVAMMSQIYRNAAWLLVWLGPSSMDSLRLMELVRAIHDNEAGEPIKGDDRPYLPIDNTTIDAMFKSRARLISWSGLRRRPRQFGSKRCDDIDTQAVGLTYANALLRIFDLPWFGRAWVLQEVILAREFVFLMGNEVVESACLSRLKDFFDHAWLWCYHLRYVIEGAVNASLPLYEKEPFDSRGRSFLDRIIRIRRRPQVWLTRSCFIMHLWSLRDGVLQGYCQASDPRDVIFSLWGTYGLPLSLRPNYSLSATVVYERATLAWIEEEDFMEDLMPIHLSGGIGSQQLNSVPSLPTWVPDWSQPCRHDRLTDRFERFRTSTACRGYRHVAKRAENGQLPIRGKIVDSITYVSKWSLGEFHGPRERKIRMSWDALVEESEHFGLLIPRGLTGQPLTLLVPLRVDPTPVELIPSQYYPWGIYRDQRARVEMLDSAPTHSAVIEPSVDATTDATPDAKTMFNGIQSATLESNGDFTLRVRVPPIGRYMRLARTKGNRLCFVYSSARVGDAVAIVHGNSLPSILHNHLANTYWLVGEALVEGMNCGEIVTWAEEDADDLILI